MGRRNKKKDQCPRSFDPVPCCIACRVNILFNGDPEIIFEEREEWKQLGLHHDPTAYAVVRSEDVEGMYFGKAPWLWTALYRASKYCSFLFFSFFSLSLVWFSLSLLLTSREI